jgi:hypothetical protein
MTTIGSSLCKTMIEAAITGDLSKFDREIVQVQSRTADWHDLLSAAQHAACLVQFESARELSKHIRAIANIADRARSAPLRQVPNQFYTHTFSAL